MKIKRTPSSEIAIREVETSYILDSQKKVHGQGPADYQLGYCIVGEAPGYDEERDGRPFVGKSGKALDAALYSNGINRLKCWITNAITVRPPSNKIATDEGKEALEAHTEEFWKEIEYVVRERGVRTIIALGNTAMQMLNIPGTVTKVRGSVISMSLNWRAPIADFNCEGADFFVIPTYHPSYMLRNGFHKRGEANVSLYGIWYHDFKKAKSIQEDGYVPPKESFNYDPTPADVVAFTKDAINTQKLVALDIETDGLNPMGDNIVTVGLSLDGESGISIRLRDSRTELHHDDNGTRGIYFSLQRLLDNASGFILQNAKYDLKWLIQKGFHFKWEKLKHDTMVLHHTVNPEHPHNLGFITSVYGKTAYWKENTNWDEGSIYKRSPKELAEYNIRDCVVLHQILPGLLKDLEDLGPETQALYYEEALPMVEVVTKMEMTGAPWSESRKQKIREALNEDIPRLESEMRSIAGLPNEFEFKASHLALALFGEVHSSLSRAEKDLPGIKNTGTKKYAEAAAKVAVLRNTPHRIWDYGKSFEPATTPSGAIATDDANRFRVTRAAIRRKEYIQGLKRQTPSHELELGDIEKLLKFVELYNEHATLVKLRDTYLEYKASMDKRIHANWKNTGTATGRLSSASPNLMNLPKPLEDGEGGIDWGGKFRGCIVAPKGYKVISADYSNLEVGTVAYETGEPNLIRIFEDRLNQHDINTRALFGLTPEDKMWKPARQAAKVFQFGRLNYGGGDKKIYRDIVEQVPQLGLTYTKYMEAVRSYFESNPKYAEWEQRVKELAITDRIGRNAFGRVRTFYGATHSIEKQALNFPCQSAAASIINRASIRIVHRMPEEFPLAELILQIHDQLVFLIPEYQVDDFCEMLTEEMEKPVMFYGVPRIFPVEVEVGDDFEKLEKWKEAA